MTDQIYTQVTAKVPGTDHFLVNPDGVVFDKVTASCLVKVHLDCKASLDPTNTGINPAGFLIQSCVHCATPHFNCVLHAHSAAGLAVAAQKRGLPNLTQHAMRLHRRLACHDYEGIELDFSGQSGLTSDLEPTGP